MPAPAAELGLRRQREVQHLARLAAAASDAAWAAVDPSRIALSWGAQIPRAFVAVSGAQVLAAAGADAYVGAALDAQDITAAPSGSIRASRFSQIASDGRSLETLLYQPAIRALEAVQSGAGVASALQVGRLALDVIVRTQVADAGRAATGVGLASRGVGYVRLLTPPSCSRCAVLAGRFYRWSTGFQRHPRCDCVHVPTSSGKAAALKTSPRAYFGSLPAAEQDRIFTQAGAAAIRAGADVGQVVNARRGMQAAGVSETRINAAGHVVNARHRTRAGGATTEGTRQGGSPKVRLMPEEIYRRAQGDRTEALRLLELHGYLY